MRLIFAGTPAFAAEALAALHAAGHDIVLVLTTPDKRAGRGMQLTPSATAELAAALHLRVEKPANLKDPAVQLMLSTAQADAMVVAAYGLLLPQAVLDIPPLGCLNIHGSLLPRWRGAAPVQRAIAAGDAETGISIMQMNAGLDTGAVLLTAAMPILPDDTSASLFAKLARLGATTIVAALEQLPNLRPQPQPAEGASYAQKIKKAEARIDWTRPAVELERKLRAFDPFPGAEALFAENILKIWRADVIDNLAAHPSTLPGMVISSSENAVCVQCGRGALALKMVQKPAGRRQPISEFLRHTHIQPGAMFT